MTDNGNGRGRPVVGETAPSDDTSASDSTRRTLWMPEPRHTRALDRHIARCYGPEYVRGWAA